MGYTVELTCLECNHRKIYNLGRSKEKLSLSEVLKWQSQEVAAAVHQMDKAYSILDYEYGKQLMHCKGCHEIWEEELLIVTFNNASDYIVAKYCSKCGNLLKILEVENIAHIRCPRCLNYRLNYRHICDWK